MKKIFVFGMAFGLVAITSCKKDASQIQGQVRYIDSTGMYWPAAGAVMTLHENDTSKSATMSVTANAEGIYNMTSVPDGVYVVMGTLMVDSTLTYVGVSNKFECSKKDFVASPVDMQ